MIKKTDLTGMRFGNRLVIQNECDVDDWININKPVPSETRHYYLCKCLNCGAIIPTHRCNLMKNPPKRCVFCSNIGNHHDVKTETNSWVVKNNDAMCNVMYKSTCVTFVVDLNDYEKVNAYTWRISKKKNKYYVVSGSSKKGTMLYLHQLILGENSDGMEIDHIDGNSLNNRKSNLRFVTHQQNVDNIIATRIDNMIGIRGISFDKKAGKYTVDFHYHGTRVYFKPWNTIEEAVYCRFVAESMFGLTMLVSNPIAKQYYLEDEYIKSEIKQYVHSKIAKATV